MCVAIIYNLLPYASLFSSNDGMFQFHLWALFFRVATRRRVSLKQVAVRASIKIFIYDGAKLRTRRRRTRTGSAKLLLCTSAAFRLFCSQHCTFLYKFSECLFAFHTHTYSIVCVLITSDWLALAHLFILHRERILRIMRSRSHNTHVFILKNNFRVLCAFWKLKRGTL